MWLICLKFAIVEDSGLSGDGSGSGSDLPLEGKLGVCVRVHVCVHASVLASLISVIQIQTVVKLYLFL